MSVYLSQNGRDCFFSYHFAEKRENMRSIFSSVLIRSPDLVSSLAPSPPEKEESTDVRQEKPDLRLRHGFHHQCHAHRSKSDAAERHGVTACTVSMGSGQSSHDLTSCTCSQSWTSHNPSTSRISAVLLFWYSFCFLFFSSPFLSSILEVPHKCRQN